METHEPRKVVVAIAAGLRGQQRIEAIEAAVEQATGSIYNNLFFKSNDGHGWTYRASKVERAGDVESVVVELFPVLPLVLRRQDETLPNAFGILSRLQIFEASTKPTYRRRSFCKSSWGSAYVTGRLGQKHAALLEALILLGHKTGCWPEGIAFLVDPYRLRRLLSSRGDSYSYEGLRTLLADLMAATIEFEQLDGQWVMLHLLKQVEGSEPRAVGERGMALLSTKRPWRICLGEAAHVLLGVPPVFWRDEAQVRALVALKSGISQAIARHVLTHSVERQPDEGWFLDHLIEAVAPGTRGVRLCHRRTACVGEAEGLFQLGIVVGPDKTGIQRVRFAKPGEEFHQAPGQP